MEEDGTSLRFKTQWLNETLKFIRNDQILKYKYPEWPMSRVTFYHALLAQCQLKAGLGIKTLYAPLWEAMQVFGLKYTFKVTIIHCEEPEKGCLVFEKIPKKTEEDNETDSEEESECKHKLTKKAEQAYLLNKAIVERNSPTFIKNTLQSLLSFISDEASASVDFKNLAPIEAKFIQNIQAIHDQKFLFYKIFTPSAIEILKKISTGLKMFKNTYNIKIGNVRTHPKTSKREITITKEPNFGSPSLQALSASSTAPSKKGNKSKPSLSLAPLRTPKSINPKPIPSFDSTSHIEIPVTVTKERDKLDKTKEEKQPNRVKEMPKTKTTRQTKSRLINVEDVSHNESAKENSLSNSNKTEIELKSSTSVKKIEESNIKVADNVKKSATIPEKVEGNTKDPLPADNSKPSLSRSGQKKAMIDAMSKPMESDKGLRMMKLMGWEGGALGARGDGIIEPIIPALNLKPKAGLGAPPIKIKETVELKTKKGKKEAKASLVRFQFLEGLLEALDKGSSVVRFNNSLNTKEVRFYILNIVDLNRRSRVSHNGPNQKIMVDKILDKLKMMPNKMFDYSFMNNASELCLHVVNKIDGVSVPKPVAPTPGSEELPEKLLDIDNYLRSTTGKPKRKKTTVSRTAVKLYTLVMVAEFVESDDTDLNMDFSFGFCKKVYQYMQRVCDVINEGKANGKIKSAEEVKLLAEISAGLKHSFLSVHLFSPLVTVRKLKLSSKQRQMVDYDELFNIPPKGKANDKKDESDSDSDNENKSSINNSMRVEVPNHGKKTIDFTNDSFSEMINFKTKTDKEETIEEANISSDKSEEHMDHESLHNENEEISTDNKNEGKSILIKENLSNIDYNYNLLNGDINSEIKINQSCDTNSRKDNIDLKDEVEKYSIDVLEYKEYRIVKIVVQDWEQVENLFRKIQENIMNCDYFIEDNYLKCHGVQNGGLVYYYSNEDWLKDILSKNFHANFIWEIIEKFKLKVHINSFIKIEDVFKALELHNRGLCTTDWTVLEEGNCYFVVDVDCDSFQFVCDHRFSLFAGVDTALFTIVL
ncbi:uncharacterized protein LOC121738513 [Aricia agestis]|uniref:uncharacterized protein LOC121738513 n=1 Tax=Aricia agestis TaxID=91739 RepID=UPI001C20944F|nr:uncharacterized protein LOC121738513 [Aricia agestis]